MNLGGGKREEWRTKKRLGKVVCRRGIKCGCRQRDGGVIQFLSAGSDQLRTGAG